MYWMFGAAGALADMDIPLYINNQTKSQNYIPYMGTFADQ
jgi:hypothetical protein